MLQMLQMWMQDADADTDACGVWLPHSLQAFLQFASNHRRHRPLAYIFTTPDPLRIYSVRKGITLQENRTLFRYHSSFFLLPIDHYSYLTVLTYNLTYLSTLLTGMIA